MLKKTKTPPPLSPQQIRMDEHRRRIARLLLRGHTVSDIARKLKRHEGRIRAHVATPEFQALYRRLQQDRDDAIRRRQEHLLDAAYTAIERLLRSSNLQAVNAAIVHVLRLAGVAERYDVRATTTHHPPEPLISESQLTDEQRKAAREILELERQYHQRALPARLKQGNHTGERDETTGRYRDDA